MNNVYTIFKRLGIYPAIAVTLVALYGALNSGSSYAYGPASEIQKLSDTGAPDKRWGRCSEQAYDSVNDRYMVVWIADNADKARYDRHTYARVYDASDDTSQPLTPVSSEIEVGSSHYNCGSGVAFDPVTERYLVTRTETEPTLKEHQVYATLFDKDGTAIKSDFLLTDFKEGAYESEVDYNPVSGEFLVTVAGDERYGSKHKAEIHGQRVDSDGNEVGTNDFRISETGPDGGYSDQGFFHNTVVDSDGNYMVVWESLWFNDPNYSGFEIKGQLMASDETVLQDDIRISTSGQDNITDFSIYFATHPSVAYNPDEDEFLVIWSGNDDTTGFPGPNETEVLGARLDGDANIIETGKRMTHIGTEGDFLTGHIDFSEKMDIAYDPSQKKYIAVFPTFEGSVPKLGDPRWFDPSSIWYEYFKGGRQLIYSQVYDADAEPVLDDEIKLSNAYITHDGDTINDDYSVFPSIVYNSNREELLLSWTGTNCPWAIESEATPGDYNFEVHARTVSSAYTGQSEDNAFACLSEYENDFTEIEPTPEEPVVEPDPEVTPDPETDPGVDKGTDDSGASDTVQSPVEEAAASLPTELAEGLADVSERDGVASPSCTAYTANKQRTSVSKWKSVNGTRVRLKMRSGAFIPRDRGKAKAELQIRTRLDSPKSKVGSVSISVDGKKVKASRSKSKVRFKLDPDSYDYGKHTVVAKVKSKRGSKSKTVKLPIYVTETCEKTRVSLPINTLHPGSEPRLRFWVQAGDKPLKQVTYRVPSKIKLSRARFKKYAGKEIGKFEVLTESGERIKAPLYVPESSDSKYRSMRLDRESDGHGIKVELKVGKNESTITLTDLPEDAVDIELQIDNDRKMRLAQNSKKKGTFKLKAEIVESDGSKITHVRERKIGNYKHEKILKN